MIAPTFDEWARISATVIVSVPRGSASWIDAVGDLDRVRQRERVDGVTSRSESAPATVTSLNVEPGSYVSVTARLRCSARETLGYVFAS